MINDKINRAQWVDSAWISSKSFNSIPHCSKVNHRRNPTEKQKNVHDQQFISLYDINKTEGMAESYQINSFTVGVMWPNLH